MKYRQQSGSKFGREVKRGSIVVLVIVLLFVSFKIGRFGFLGLQIYQHGSRIVQLADGDLAQAATALEPGLENLSSLFTATAAELRPLDPVLSQLDGYTTYGTTLAHAWELTSVGASISDIALEGLHIGLPLLHERRTGTFPAELATLAGQSAVSIAELSARVDQVVPQLDALGDEDMHPAVLKPLAQGTATLGLGAAVLKLAPTLPRLMGMDQPRTYLILIQNNHELRATGGFITAIGRLTIANGEIVGLDFKDSYDVANHNVEHPPAPEPMREFLEVELMFLRDTNWSPDLPTAAQLVKSIYMLNEGITVDGVVTVDLRAVQLLMRGLGPLRVKGVAQAITSDNIVEQIKLFWQQSPQVVADTQSDEGSWWQHRKDFMPFLGEAAIQRIQKGGVDNALLIQALHQSLEERAIQIWVQEPEAAEQLAILGWDGSLRPPLAGDFLALVDSNFGYNKVDSVLEREIDYRVSWPEGPEHRAQAETTVTYRHPLNIENHQCDITPRYGTTYDDMAARCYFDFVRLYVPQGSRLLDVAGVDLTTAKSQLGENGTQLFSAYFIAQPGSEHSITFSYELPESVQIANYQLSVRRQSGTKPLPFTADINGQMIHITIDTGTSTVRIGER